MIHLPKLSRFRFRHIFTIGGSAVVVAALLLTDPDHGLSTGALLLSLAVPFLALLLAHWARKALFDYGEADMRRLFAEAKTTSVGAGLALVALAIILAALLGLFGRSAHAAVPERAAQYLPILAAEIDRATQYLEWAERPEALEAYADDERSTAEDKLRGNKAYALSLLRHQKAHADLLKQREETVAAARKEAPTLFDPKHEDHALMQRLLVNDPRTAPDFHLLVADAVKWRAHQKSAASSKEAALKALAAKPPANAANSCPSHAIRRAHRFCHSITDLMTSVTRASRAKSEATAKAATDWYSLYRISTCRGIVLVWPRMWPDTTDTAPNSPMARALHRITP